MKTKLFLGLTALAFMTSCSNDESVSMAPQTNAIGFENAFVDKAGRAVDLTTQNLTNFGVYGFMNSAAGTLFNNEEVSKSGTDWTYGNTQYWIAGQTYWFSAIAPYTDAKWTYDASAVEGGTISFDNQAANGEQDLLYAWSGEITTPDPLDAPMNKVAFTFNHLLSRVKFSFENGMGSDFTKLEVSEITITNAYGKGTIDMSAGAAAATWTVSDQSELAFGDVAEIGRDLTEGCDHKYLIPANVAYDVTFTVTMYQASLPPVSYNHTVTIPAVNMLKGYSYNFKARFTGDNIDPEEKLYPIEFDVEKVEEWGDFADQPVTLP